MGVADHVLESISGHLSRRTLEHYPRVVLAGLVACKAGATAAPSASIARSILI
jgi:hypothetical protein